MTAPTDTPAATPDPMPAAALGMWLFLAGDAMFFAGLLVAFLVLQSTPAQRTVFVRSTALLNGWLTGAAIALLVVMSLVTWRAASRLTGQVGVAALAVAFLGVQAAAGQSLLSHRTVVTSTAVYDGRAVPDEGGLRITGVTVPLPPTLDLGTTLPGDLHGASAGWFGVPAGAVRANAGYGPSRNNYFACWFLSTVVHALHVVGGLVALAGLAVATRRGSATQMMIRGVSLYWQFVSGVGLLMLVLLALG